MTSLGGEGMVVKPFDLLCGRGQRPPRQPAIKIRGPEYLRIIYGPEYGCLGICSGYGSVASPASGRSHREFALGIEVLESFIRKEALRRVHECAFGVLALESEPVDTRPRAIASVAFLARATASRLLARLRSSRQPEQRRWIGARLSITW